jgi:anhydro-N-acetylmuramic acid kinase
MGGSRGVRAIGLMSGTSMDGVDIAVLETDGVDVGRFGRGATYPYCEPEREMLRRAIEAGRGLSDRTARPGVLREAESLVTALHAAAVENFLRENGIDRASIEVVGFHGQTVLHRPAAGLTVQIGDGAALARKLGLAVVYDFRAADTAAGGQGAPLVPVFHQALARKLDRPHPIGVLNIGGVANVTWVDGGDPIACDTGPGNAMIDDFMRARAGDAYDENGDAAAKGWVDEDFVARMLEHPFFAAQPPKSLDRNDFALSNIGLPPLSLADGAATLAALTASAVARIVPHLPKPPRSWIVAGGGARNRTLVRMLAERLAPAAVETAAEVGWSADVLEAQAFAFLAVRTLRGLPITFPTTTGVPRPTIGGVVADPAARPAAKARAAV